MSVKVGDVWVCLVVHTALLLRMLEERVDIVTDDDTGLSGENVFGTHCIGSIEFGEVLWWYWVLVDFFWKSVADMR
jgi:hypothetical protein